ncbi:hypothetical protein SAMN04487911_1623, partial [Arenibacter nanhaiticus]
HYRTAQYETRTLGGVRGAVRFYLGADPSTRLPPVLITEITILNKISIVIFYFLLIFNQFSDSSDII